MELGDVSLMAAACAERRELLFLYRDHGGASTNRTVEPHRIVHTGRRWYLVAWDRDRDDWRTFRIDRVSDAVPSGAHFMQRSSPDDDVGAYVTRGITASVHKVEARVVLHGPIDTVRPQVPPWAGQLEAIDDGTCALSTGATSLDMLLLWLATIGVDFEVREPPELHQRMTHLAERLSRAASRA